MEAPKNNQAGYQPWNGIADKSARNWQVDLLSTDDEVALARKIKEGDPEALSKLVPTSDL